MNKGSQQFSQLELERYVLLELEPRLFAKLQSEAENDERLKTAIVDIHNSNKAILEQYPTDYVVGRIRSKLHSLEKQKRRLHSITWGRPLVYLSVCFVFVFANLAIFTTDVITPVPDQGGGVRVKGDEQKLFVYRKNVSAVEMLKDMEVVHHGDTLQVAYQSFGNLYGAIFSIDNENSVTMHFPDDATGVGRLETGKLTVLRKGYRLDDSGGAEVFYFLTAEQPLDLNRIRTMLHENAGRSVAEIREMAEFRKYEITSVTLVKGNRR